MHTVLAAPLFVQEQSRHVEMVATCCVMQGLTALQWQQSMVVCDSTFSNSHTNNYCNASSLYKANKGRSYALGPILWYHRRPSADEESHHVERITVNKTCALPIHHRCDEINSSKADIKRCI